MNDLRTALVNQVIGFRNAAEVAHYDESQEVVDAWLGAASLLSAILAAHPNNTEPLFGLLDTREGLALAAGAYQQGASEMLRACNDDSARSWKRPDNPYSIELLKMIKGDAK